MNINIRTSKNFTTAFNQLSSEFGEEMAHLNGLADTQLSYTDFIDNFIDKNTIADASIDGSSNVNHKDIVSLENEMSKPHAKLLALNKIFHELNKKYGFKAANDWLRNEWDGHQYLHDASSASFRSYCFAYDLEDLVNKGLFFIEDFNADAPHHQFTYVDFVAEFVSWTCNRSSGSVGLPSYLIYAYYFWKKDCETGYYIKSPEYYRDQGFQEIIYRLNQPYLRQSIQSAFTNFTIFDRPYLESLFSGRTYPDGTFVIDYIDELLDYQMEFMRVVDEIRSVNMMTFPVLTFSLLRKDGKFADEEFAKRCCAHNMKWADANFFIDDDITSLSSCCRLRTNIETLGYFNSIGGTALKVGSVKVNTINLARLAYENKKPAQYLEALSSQVQSCLQALDSVRTIIRRNVEKGLLPNYSHNIIELSHQYNTIGVIGLYEALQKYGHVYKDEFGYTYYTDAGVQFAKEILASINRCKDEFAATVDYMINIEQIPGEKAAATLMEKDRLIFPKAKYELPLYGNQWIPLGVKTTLQEKIRLSAELDNACNGGSIAHINLDAPLTDFETAWNLLNYIADAGVTYFAFNLRINACEKNHGFYGDTCPTCGGEATTSYQRIVGFITPEKSYSKERKVEFALRDWFDLNKLTDV